MEEKRYTKKLFGGKISIIIYSDKDTGGIVESAYKEALKLQKIFNFYDPESELSELNKKRKLKTSKELLEVIKRSMKFSKLTKGSYDVTLGKIISERKSGLPETEERVSYKDIKIKGSTIELKNPDSIIDLGSIAKGYITDKISDFLKRNGVDEFIIDSRGDLIFSGDMSHIIGIQNPRGDKEILRIKIKDSSIATSGDYNQFYGNFEKSHILNQKDVISVTVVSKRLEDADALATSLFVSDKNLRLKIMNKFLREKAFVIDKNFEVEYYNNFQDMIA